MIRKLIAFSILSTFLILNVSGASINSFDIDNNEILAENEYLNFTLNTSETDNASIKFSNDQKVVVSKDNMSLVEESDYYSLFKYSYLVDSNSSGDMIAEVNASGEESVLETRRFHVATDEPRFISQDNVPDFAIRGDDVKINANLSHSEGDFGNVTVEVENQTYEMVKNNEADRYASYQYSLDSSGISNFNVNYSVTASDATGNTKVSKNGFYVYNREDDASVNVKIAPTCRSSMSYFLLPGDGEIVRNKTGVFVEIISNTGNIESNVSIDYLDVTREGDEAWSRGDPIGDIIESFKGEKFTNLDIQETATYFKLFLANYDFGNYTGRTSVTTECEAKGPINEQRDKSNLNDSYSCDTSKESFECFNVSVYDEDLVTTETTTANITNVTDQTVTEQREDTTGYKGEATLNGTRFDVFTFNGVSGENYDYGCVTEGSLSEDRDCAYEGQLINEYNVEIDNITLVNSTEAVLSFKERNEDRLNTTLDCSSTFNQSASCNTTFSFFSNFKVFGNFEIVDAIGEESGGVNDIGNQSTNQTIPEDVNRSGDQETNQTVSGDNDNPGQTETPEPEPEPVPEPDPQPMISVVIESLNESVTTTREDFVPATFNVTNEGNQEMEDLTLQPDAIYEDWEVRDASVNSLSPGESVRRRVFIQPGEFTATGSYAVPVSAFTENDTELDLDYVEVEVIENETNPRHELAEVPRNLRVEQGSSQSFPVLVENTGDTELENLNAQMQNIEDCGRLESDSIGSLQVNDSVQLNLQVKASNSTEECESTLIVSSEQGSYAFSSITFTVLPDEGLIPEEQRAPFLAIIWTMLLIAYAFATRRYDLDSLMVKAPFIALIVGETVLILYLMSTVYGLPGAALLPF